jgi:hypothetical protein
MILGKRDVTYLWKSHRSGSSHPNSPHPRLRECPARCIKVVVQEDRSRKAAWVHPWQFRVMMGLLVPCAVPSRQGRLHTPGCTHDQHGCLK